MSYSTPPKLHRCAFPAPERKWEQNPETGKWFSRPWEADERQRYEREVLGRA